VSLQNVFVQAHEIRDLAARPHERIALLRLLICVAQTALDGPADENGWLTCRDELPLRVSDYLTKWHKRFELFGDGPRFLQVDKLSAGQAGDDDKGTAVDKLDVALASGNNSTLFDNHGGSDRTFEPGQLAVMLVTFQSFAPGGLVGIAKWNGKPTAATKAAP